MRGQRIIIPILSAFIGAMLAILSTKHLVTQPSSNIYSATQDTPINVSATHFQTSDGAVTDFTYAAEKTVNAVVHVKTVATRETQSYSYGHPFFDFFFGPQFRPQQPSPQPSVGSGSGVIISADGYILTNNHVVERFDEIEVTFNDNRVFSASLVGRDPTTDLALLKIAAEDLPFLSFGSSDDLRVGEWVLAVGNPFNLNSTVTAGIVSAKARNINILSGDYRIESFIQTDAAVNPGNSGGALVNLRGELVGINTAISSRTGSFVGYAFAIPSTIAQKVAMDIIELGEVQRALLGVTISPLNSESAKKYNINALRGVLITGVGEKSAANDAGLKEGDVILQVNGVPVNSPSQLQEQISKFRPNDKVELLVNRKNKTETFHAVLRNMKGGFDIIKATDTISILGAELKEVDEKTMKELGIRSGVQIEKLSDGKLKEAGVKQGYIITRINRTPVRNPEDIRRLLENQTGGVLIEGVYPNGVVTYYAIGL